MSVATELHEDVFAASFAALPERLRRDPAWLRALREAASERLAASGLPRKTDEEWRATSIAPILARPWHHPAALGRRRLETFLDVERVARAHLGSPGTRLVFLDARCERDLSAAGRLPPGITARSLRAALAHDGALIRRYLAREAAGSEPFVALNTALQDDGAFVHVGVDAPEPIRLVHVATGEGIASYPRNLIVLEPGVRASVVESYLDLDRGGDQGRSFSNAVTEIVLGEGASLDHTQIERGGEGMLLVSSLEVAQGPASHFRSRLFAFGGALVRNDVRVRLEGEGAECNLAGLSLLDGRDHVDNHVLVDHARPHGRSGQLYKGVFDGFSRGVFTGKIVVRPDAVKTDARQSSRSLLLSDDALVDTRPQLQIHADDVKCAHGAAVGQLDEDALFYLRARGLDAGLARALLVQAFAGEITGTVSIAALRSHLDALVSGKLGREESPVIQEVFPASRAEPLDVARVREDFPILAQTIHGAPLAYLDNAATTQKPRAVLDAVSGYYELDNANVHRGVHDLSLRATSAYEGARARVQSHLGAASAHEIIFVRGTTEAINLVAQTFGRARVGAGDEVLVTEMEHHSNIVPWQLLCEEKGATLRVAPITDAGEIDLDRLEALMGPRTKILAVVHVSNALGTINPVAGIIARAHARGIPVLVDGAQAVPHLPVDVVALDCDFYAFSSHKIYGPTGVGVLYGKERLLEAMPPYQGGGDMISSVSFDRTVWNRLPWKFEAGTPHVSGAIGLRAALDYMAALGPARVLAHESALLEHATTVLSRIPGLEIKGTTRAKAGVVSFVLEGAHPHDLGTILDQQGIAIRTGHHCAQPLMQRLGVPATARASFAVYNTKDEIDRLAAGIEEARRVLQ